MVRIQATRPESTVSRRWRQGLLFLWVFCIASPLCGQQNIVTIVSEQNPSLRGVVGTFAEKGIIYGSLRDIATDLSIALYINPTTKKGEITLRQQRIKVTADNPFVVISDSLPTEGSVFQMPVTPIYGANTLYVPIEYFIPILEKHTEYPIRYSAETRTIMVGTLKPKPVYDITGIGIEERVNGYLLRINATKHFSDCESWVKPDGWVYVTIPNARADVARLNSMKPFSVVNSVIAIQQPGSVQLTLRCDKKFSRCEIIPDPGENDILISLLPAEYVNDEVKKQRVLKTLEKQRNKWNMDVVVIDAGHGGRDPGAIGTRKTKEKDITLGIALKLGRLIAQKLNDVKVVYTRTDDRFIELYWRGQIANEEGGKLFISIHCNSMPRKPHPANGFEIYLLKPNRTEEAVAIASRENAVVKFEEGYEKRYKELTEENFIILTMAQSAYAHYSEQFAQETIQSMQKTLPITNNGVKQAGFYVLVGASMPNVLVEAGYLSNRSEEQYLASQKGQQKIAEAIFTAVKNYKVEYEKTLDEGGGK
jgi:N-acetylmuramoyl-L-alanine amidase